MTKFKCFGFYNDSVTCNTCVASKRCRAIMVSDGAGLVEALLDEIVANDPGVMFFDTDRPSEMVSQLLNPSQRKVALDQQGVIDELFGDDTTKDGGFAAADTAARSGRTLEAIGEAMKKRDNGQLEDEIDAFDVNLE